MRKYIVKDAVGVGFNCKAVYMRCGPNNQNLVQLAICPCGKARKLARVLNAVHKDKDALPLIGALEKV